jgi:hypothetical protein
MEVFPCSKNIQTLHAASLEYFEQHSQLGRLQILNRIHAINSGKEYNFKGVQTLWEKFDKITKILSQKDLHKSEFSWVYLCAKIWSSKTSVKMN